MNQTKQASPLRPAAMRALPQDLGAEAAVLGSMIVDPRCIAEVLEVLRDRSAFNHLQNQYIFDAIVHLWEGNKGTGVDGLLVRQELECRGRLAEIGGPEYLEQVMNTVPSSANVAYYRDIVLDKALAREMIAAGAEIINDAYDGTGDSAERLDAAERRIYAISDKRVTAEAVATEVLAKTVYNTLQNRAPGELTGLCTGFSELDMMTTGLHPGEVVFIAGRPSMGKTALAMNIVENMAVGVKTPVAVFSLEMTKEQLTERLMASSARVKAQLLRQGLLPPERWADMSEALGRIGEAPIYIDDTPSMTPLLLRAKARRLQSRYGIQCVVVDYLQLMTMGPGWKEGRQQEVTALSRQLKAMARELNVPVIILCQLNRSAESREDHRPRLSDLRESGSLEQDADLVLLLHREDYYHHGEEGFVPDHVAEVMVAKQRNGPTGVAKLCFLEDSVRFENPASRSARAAAPAAAPEARW